MTGFWERTADLVPDPPARGVRDDAHDPAMPNGTDDPAFWVSLLAERARQPDGADVAPSPSAPATAEKKPGRMLAVQLPRRPIEQIPPRPWAYGFYMLRGQAAVLAARDGGGKGAIATVMALAFVTGQALLSERAWTPGPVAIITYEDDRDEWERRLGAACRFHGLDHLEVMQSVYFLALPDRKIVLAALREGRTMFPDGDEVIETLRAVGAVACFIDPFNHCHEMNDGNNNPLIAQVAGEITRIATESATAILMLHHLRKGATGDPDDMMGATALRATFRSTRILTRMDPKTAEQFKLEEPWRYIRIAGTKENYAPPPDKATWFRLNSVALNNATDEYPEGDNVAAASSWSPPSPFDGLSWADTLAVLGAIDVGLPDGERYSAAPQASRWAGRLLMDLGRAKDQATRCVKAWVAEGLLMERKYDSSTRREEVMGLYVDPERLSAMRAAASAPMPESGEEE